MDGVLVSFCSSLPSFIPPVFILLGKLAFSDCLKRLLCSQWEVGSLDGGRRMKLGYLLP